MNVKEFLSEHWKYFLGLALVVAVLVFVYMEYKESKSTVAPPVVKTKVTSTDTTAVSYVPKVSPRDSDVEITKAPPKVAVSVNGQQHEFSAVQGETQKFQNGKLIVEQESTLKVDMSVQVEKQITNGINKALDTKFKNEISIGASNHGTEIRYSRTIGNNLSIYVNSTTNTQHRGVGIGIKF